MQTASLLPTLRSSPAPGNQLGPRYELTVPLQVIDVQGLLGEPESRQPPEPEAPNHNQFEAQAGNSWADFDEYGTELHKDTRVWKVYITEADKHDAELVNGWNKSIDVILIFAALFSAISTAFLIESTKLLQPDPAEELGRSLLAISQTLSAIANGTQSPGSVHPHSSDSAEFTPSRAAVWVNVLWYLSLGLSLATSFIAILAKDWSHSFMSGRTGHPYSQMCRRQRKWNMIEKWKMLELLTILPSLIHIALLLFSVGLCIFLSDIHALVAIPVFCTIGAAIGFYIWSSIVAISIDYFPYQTIISRVCRTEVARHTLQTTVSFASRFGSHPVIRNLCQMAMALVFVCVWILILLSLVLMMVCLVFKMLKDPLNKCDAYLTRSSPVLQLVAVPLSKSVRLLIWYPAAMAFDWIYEICNYLVSIADPMWSALSGATWGLQWQEWDPRTRAQAGGNDHKQDDVTSLALSWLITNCEVPQSVDIALQSIAGATSRTSRQPLLDCHATLEILRRLASSNLYKGSDTRTDMMISLYSRALAWLGSASGPSPDSERHGSELEGLLWDVHLESERRVAASIVSGRFNLTRANLDTLRIGSTAASHALKLLGRDPQKTNVDIEQTLGLIANRLEAHVSHSESLHDAALLSLVNATALLLPFSLNSSTVASLGSLCVRIIEPQLNASTASNLPLVNLAIICAYTACQSMDPESPDNSCSRFLLRDVVGRLVRCYTETATPRISSTFGLEVLATHPEAWKLASFDIGVRDAMLNFVASSIDKLYNSFSTRYHKGTGVKKTEDDMLESLRAVQSPLSLAPIASRTYIPFLILGPIRHLCSLTSYPINNDWAKLASDSRFPTLSPTLIQLVEQSNFVSHSETMIEKGDRFEKFTALGQLWLLFTAYLDASSDAPNERERLGVQLKKYKPSDPETENARHAQIGNQLVPMGESWELHILGSSLGGWPARLMECVYESRNSPPPQRIYGQLQWHNVPDELRGLSSFTSWRPRSIEIDTGDVPQPMCDGHAATNDESAIDNDHLVPEIGGVAIVDETKDPGVGGRISLHSGQGVLCKGSEVANIAPGTADGGEVTEREGNTTTLGDQREGDTGSRTGYLAIEPGNVGNDTDGVPHVCIDIDRSEKISK